MSKIDDLINGEIYTVSARELAEGLSKLQERACGYGTRIGDRRACDCKYGADPQRNFEATGCPELRLASIYFSRLADMEEVIPPLFPEGAEV